MPNMMIMTSEYVSDRISAGDHSKNVFLLLDYLSLLFDPFYTYESIPRIDCTEAPAHGLVRKYMGKTWLS